MRILATYCLCVFIAFITGCAAKKEDISIQGTWELVSATSTEKGTTTSTFDPTHKMIKIISPTHFAFLNHATNPPKDSSNQFTAGGGTYTFTDSTYTEHLDYFSDKNWEKHAFPFTVKFVGDTLIQRGVEKIEKLGIDHVIVEKYKRVMN